MTSLPVARLGLCAALIVAATAAPAADPAVVISALHYNGRDGVNDEAVQLANLSAVPAVLDANWSLVDAAGHRRAFPAAGFTLAPGERAWVARFAASFARQFGFQPALVFGQMTGSDLTFPNHGGSLQLVRALSDTVDTANATGGAWPAGAASPAYRSMERIDPGGPDEPANWITASITTAIAFDANGDAIQGTPGAANTLVAAGLVTPTLSPGRGVVINEVAWAGTAANSAHEWIELFNNLSDPVDVAGWQLRIADAIVALTGTVPARGTFLIQRNVATFSDGALANLTASFSLPNAGAALRLVDARSHVVDALVYGDGHPAVGWSGPPLQPWTVSGVLSADGQVLARRIGADGSLAADTDTAVGWLSEAADSVDGRHIAYPGWALEALGAPVTATSALTLAVAPDGSFDALVEALSTARQTIDIEVYTFDHPALAGLLTEKIRAGVRVRVLLEGAPVGGMPNAERWACAMLSGETASSGCWYMRSDSTRAISARYKSVHAKFAILDDWQLIVATENFGANGFPDDDKSDGTRGQRGSLAILDAPVLVARARAVFDADLNGQMLDICRFGDPDCPMGQPAPGYVPITVTGGVSYTARYTRPLVLTGPVAVELNTSPENTLRRGGGLIGLLDAAGAGDEIVAEQLDEPRYWGTSSSNPTDDPNPRLEAMISAARRGARVRLLFDAYYDDPRDPRGNAATAAALNALARSEGLDLRAATGDPTAHGIHNKLFLARIGPRRVVHLGSWNGSEVSAKANREMTIQIDSPEAWGLMRAVFEADFWRSQPIFLPAALSNASPARSRLLISEVLYNPAGADEIGREWVEVYNPGTQRVSLAGWKIGDAEAPGRSYNEGMHAFPPDASIPGGGVLVIAGDALKFQADWGRKPDYELGGYDPGVPDLIVATAWSTGTMALGNGGDQVLLLDADDAMVDAAQWLTTTLAGIAPFTATLGASHSLQRWPPAADTDNCAVDFRDQAMPSPGRVP